MALAIGNVGKQREASPGGHASDDHAAGGAHQHETGCGVLAEVPLTGLSFRSSRANDRNVSMTLRHLRNEFSVAG